MLSPLEAIDRAEREHAVLLSVNQSADELRVTGAPLSTRQWIDEALRELPQRRRPAARDRGEPRRP